MTTKRQNVERICLVNPAPGATPPEGEFWRGASLPHLSIRSGWETSWCKSEMGCRSELEIQLLFDSTYDTLCSEHKNGGRGPMSYICTSTLNSPGTFLRSGSQLSKLEVWKCSHSAYVSQRLHGFQLWNWTFQWPFLAVSMGATNLLRRIAAFVQFVSTDIATVPL